MQYHGTWCPSTDDRQLAIACKELANNVSSPSATIRDGKSLTLTSKSLLLDPLAPEFSPLPEPQEPFLWLTYKIFSPSLATFKDVAEEYQEPTDIKIACMVDGRRVLT